MSEGLRRGRKATLRPVDVFEGRLMREAGMSVNDTAKYLGVSRATLLRALADLRAKLGPEKLPNGRRARSYLRRLENTNTQ